MAELIPYTTSLVGRSKSRSEWNCYAIFNCPKCLQKDIPLGISNLLNGEEYVTHYYCLNCKYSTLDKPEITSWCSLVDLEECGWEKEL